MLYGNYTQPTYSKEEWSKEMSNLESQMKILRMSNTGRKEDYLMFDRFKNSMKYVIPRSLAEQHFDLLYLNNLFQSMFDLLSLRVMNNRRTRAHTLFPNKTIIECLQSTTIAIQDPCSFKYSRYDTCIITVGVYKQILRVLLGFWSVDKDQTMQGLTKSQWGEDARKVCVYLKTVFGDTNITEDWITDYNGNNGNSAYNWEKLWHVNDNNYAMPANYPDYSTRDDEMDETKARAMFENVSLMSKY